MAADVTVSRVGGEGEHTIAMAIVEDVTEEKQARRRLEYEATHDGLTGLPNRLSFIAELDAVIAESRRTGATDYVVLFIDVNHFKAINDGYGHQAGRFGAGADGPALARRGAARRYRRAPARR